ncbi:MAG TPA: universal stress protein [Polyangiaceae bacterium]|nr:universal stress protein [Polyangiaceae bacterium]
MIRRLLVAIDESERAALVLQTAVELAGAFGAVLIPMRVLSVPPVFPPSAHVTRPDPLAPHLEAAAREDLLRATEGLEGISVAVPVIRTGAPWREILQSSEELDVDLVVIGSHGYGGWDRVLGTTAGEVANRAHRNVLIVHEREAVTSPSST